MGPIEDNFGRNAGDNNTEIVKPIGLEEVVTRSAATGDETAAVGEDKAARKRKPSRAASDKGNGSHYDTEALYGRELSKARDKVVRWRAKQVKEAYRIGEMWSELTKTLTEREVSAFLASECQVPRRDVAGYVRLAAMPKEDRDLFVEHGVAVSVLLDLAVQDEIVREKAIRMIKAGRSLQAKDLRGLKRDIGLAQAARDGKLDEARVRDIKNAAAHKARGAAKAWLASLEALANEVIAISTLDRTLPLARWTRCLSSPKMPAGFCMSCRRS
ncbi:hypothetical protein [Mesorhizobium sp. A623]